MVTIILILLFVGALLLAIGHNLPSASACVRIGSVLPAIGFGLQLFGGMAGL